MIQLSPRCRRLVCVKCSAEYPPDGTLMTCTRCGLTGILDVEYDLSNLPPADSFLRVLQGRAPNMWRYAEMLPVVPDLPEHFLRVGLSPLYESERMAQDLGVGRFYVKDDTLSPTASSKDRASAVAVVMARKANQQVVACASTGNAASSLAGMAAFAGLGAVIMVPARAPAPKVAQLRMYGAKVLRIEADYSTTWDLCQQTIERHGWYNRNCAINPFLMEGKKTTGLEIGEQLARQPIDWVAVSVGDGCTIAGIAKGLRQMVEIGMLPSMPRMLGAQAEGAAPVYRAWRGEPLPTAAETFADSIAVSVPRNLTKAVNAVKGSNGALVTVSDDQIRHDMRVLPRLSGVFVEPAAAATVAGVREAVRQGIIKPADKVVAVMTGNGLKDIASATAVAGEAPYVKANLDAIESALSEEP
ncbi:MAG: threonine synthase [Bradymonadales bacterium]|nr:threonine synthase [Bradymonadales bacterium]